jgi:hypothetical protein
VPQIAQEREHIMGMTTRIPWKRALGLIVLLVIVYLAVAYILVPSVWKRYARRHPALEDLPRITHTVNGIPGDPLNLALIGSEADVHSIMLAGEWYPADPLTMRSSLRIARTTVLRQNYDTAPVSHLYLWDRHEDLAFEKPVGHDPRKRHHVRFWRSEREDEAGRPLWAGAATYDERVGLSHTTGQVTHHIGADVDEERDLLVGDLERTGEVAEVFPLKGYHEIRAGKNGGGDPWRTDGDVKVCILVAR